MSFKKRCTVAPSSCAIHRIIAHIIHKLCTSGHNAKHDSKKSGKAPHFPKGSLIKQGCSNGMEQGKFGGWDVKNVQIVNVTGWEIGRLGLEC